MFPSGERECERRFPDRFSGHAQLCSKRAPLSTEQLVNKGGERSGGAEESVGYSEYSPRRIVEEHMFSINTTTLCTFSRTHTVTRPARFWLCNTAFLCCWLLAVLVVVVCGVFCWWYCCCCAVIGYRSLPKLIFFVLVALDWSGRGLYVWLFVWALVVLVGVYTLTWGLLLC